MKITTHTITLLGGHTKTATRVILATGAPIDFSDLLPEAEAIRQAKQRISEKYAQMTLVDEYRQARF